MSNWREREPAGLPRRPFDWGSRREERSPRDRDRERERERDRDRERERERDRDRDRDLPSFDRGRPRDGDRDDRPRQPFEPGRAMDRPGRAIEREHDRSPRNLGSSPATASTPRFNDSWPTGQGGPIPGAAAPTGPPTAGAGSNGDQPTPPQPVDTLLVDQFYAAYGNLSKQAALRVVFTDTERELKMITADREEMLQTRYDDYASSRAVLQRRQDAVDAKLKKCRSDMDANKTALGKRAQEFVGTLLAHIAKSATTSPANGPNTAGKSDLEALEKRLEGKMASYQKTLAAQESVIANQASRFSALESDAQRNHSKLEAIIAKQANQISTLETNSQRREEVIKQQELSLSTLKSDTTQLRTEIGLLKNRVQTLESSGPQVRAHLQGPDQKATMQQTATTSVRNNHTTLQRVVEKMQTAHDANTAEVAGMQKTLASFEGLQLRLESLESIVKAITVTVSANSAKEQPSAAAAATANATTTTTTTKADREEVSKLAADIQQLQISQGQKADRQEVESALNNMRGILANSVGGLADQFGELLDTHAKRLVAIEAAANTGSSTTEKQTEDEAAKDALAKQTASTAATTTAPAEAPEAEAKLKEAEVTRLKTELDELKDQLNGTVVDIKRCEAAFAALHNRYEEGQGAVAQFRQETTELLGVLQHAVTNLSSQFNNITTEELCKRILRHVGVLSGQKTADELTKRVDSLERAMHGGVNGADAGSSKKRRTSMQVSGAGTSGARR